MDRPAIAVRTELAGTEALPKTPTGISGFDDITLEGYDPHPAIKAQVSV